jgi:hypothetical protein
MTKLLNSFGLTPLQLASKISVLKAAELNDISEATFRRKYGHLIRRIGERKQSVTLSDAITLPPAND